MPALVVLAAGRGTRFGGPKQVSAVGPAGEWLLDYALFDARRAGFSRAVLVVRPGTESTFDALRSRAGPHIDVTVVPQVTGLMPPDLESGPREVPWGTAHAVLSARHGLHDEPFAVVNADDFYGREAYVLASAALERARTTGAATLVAMRLSVTLSAHGAVTRALCRVAGSLLIGLEETRGLERRRGVVVSAAGTEVDPDTLVSMNCWVLPTAVLPHLSDGFREFLRRPDAGAREFLLPAAVSDLIATGRLSVEVAEAPGPWFGLTHAADREVVIDALRTLTEQGVYPSPLWGGDRRSG